MRRKIWILVMLVGVVTLGPLGTAAMQNHAVPKRLNPYTDRAELIREGRTLFVQAGCSGCHGVQGGGGIGPPLTDDIWRYGGDDETLLKLIKGEIKESRMPAFGEVLEEDQIWKIVAYVRTLYEGEPTKVVW